MKVNTYKYKDVREDWESEWLGRENLNHAGLAMAETLSYMTTSDFHDAKKKKNKREQW